MKNLNMKNIHRGDTDAYMARIVPNNSFTFPPSMEVSVGGTIPGKESVESSREQRPRAKHGAIAEALRKSFIAGGVVNVGEKKIYGKFFHVSPAGVKHTDVLHNLFAPTRNTNNSKKPCASASQR